MGNLTDLIRFAVMVLDASPRLTYPIPEPQLRGRPGRLANQPTSSSSEQA